MASNREKEEASSSGLGRSAPLVSVQASIPHSGLRASASASLSSPPRVEAAANAMAHPLTVVQGVDVSSQDASKSPSADVPPVTPLSPKSGDRVMVSPLSPPPMKAPPSTTSLDALADTFLSGPSTRDSPLFRPLPLPKGEKGLQRLHTLVQRRAWGDVLAVSGEMLRSPSSPLYHLFASLTTEKENPRSNPLSNEYEPATKELQSELVEVIAFECHAWLKLRRYADLGKQVKAWNFVSFNNQDAVSPSWVPWSLHILGAETLQYTDPDPGKCLDALNLLRDDIEQSDSSGAWLSLADKALSNAYIRQGEWRLALSSLDNLFDSLPETVEYAAKAKWARERSWEGDEEMKWTTSILVSCCRCEVWSRQCRVLLKAGAIHEASLLCADAKLEWNTIKSTTSATLSPPGVSDDVFKEVKEFLIVRNVLSQLSIVDGLVCFACGEYDNAMAFFITAIEKQRAAQANVQEPNCRMKDLIGSCVLDVDSNQRGMTDACNNMALCALFTGRMHEAVRLIESIIRENPTAYLFEGLAFNLCTLYELGADQALSARKKRVLQLIAKRFFLHDVGPESFRLS